jgi:hypothetical protein
MPLYTEEEMKEKSAQGGALIVLLLAVAFLNSPGMLVLAVLKATSCSTCSIAAFDCGQMWTFSIMTSVALLVLLRLRARDWEKACAQYIFTCIAIAVVLLVCQFGFKETFPDRYLNFYL